MRFIVTGGCGFIGSAVVRALIEGGHRVWTIDKMTYAADEAALETARTSTAHTLVRACITDTETLRSVFAEAAPHAVIHLAAETHVDRSIDGPAPFIKTNIEGSFALLEAALAHRSSGASRPEMFRFIHVSTDEVFGDLGPDDPPFTPQTPYAPSSPYSASKAASDHLARAWGRTYGLPVIITNCSNNYGPWQHGEKLIPTVIARALNGEPIPVYGQGENVRDWLYVEDHARGLIMAAGAARPGVSLLFGGRAERSNIAMVREICALLDARRPAASPYASQISFVTDRPGHDRRYGVDPSSAEAQLGWQARETLASGLAKTVDWYLAHGNAGTQTARLGLKRQSAN